ncbi:hypothetical protein AGMMS49992_12000 [Clostridia bacterium]|nr:hypothetical protein AGMMS49992_12000 [Clostridia bacterium]
MGARAQTVANAAVSLLGNEIPYRLGGTTLQGMDCQGLVKYCCKQAGVTLNYSGSNDMYRNACSWLGTLAEAKAQKKLVPGAVAFIVVHDGGESDKYKADGLGNAGHVGIITLSGDIYSVDASSSAGKVRSRKVRDAELVWSHIGWLRALDYGSAIVEDEIGGVIMNTIRTATVNTVDGGNLNLRRAPSDNTDNRVGRVPNGTTIEVLETRADGWAKVKFEGMEVWASSRYLLMDAPEQYAPVNTPASIPAQTTSSPPIIVPVQGSGYITISLSENAAYELYNTLDATMFG